MAWLFGLAPVFQCAGASEQPNILLIITDDQDFATIGAYGGNVLTPNIDRLAKEGMLFRRAYCTTSSCAPSRYAIMTGRLASRCESKASYAVNPPGQQAYLTNQAIVLDPDRPTLPRILKSAGYRTGFVGKWHLGPHSSEEVGIHPVSGLGRLGDPEVDKVLRENQQAMKQWLQRVGFDYAASVYWDNVGEPQSYVDGLNAQNMEWTVQGALDFLDAQKSEDEPFFLWMATTLLHNPCGAAKDFAPLSGSERITPGGLLDSVPDVMRPRADIYARLNEAGIPIQIDPEQACLKYGADYCLWLDDGVGAVLDRLDELGVADNTLVIFFSDNATWGKFHTYERGCNVPLIVRWPGRITAGSESDALVANVDFAPTLLDAVGVQPAQNMCEDGVSQLEVWTGRRNSIRNHVLLEFGCSRAITDGEWKYIALRPTPADIAFGKQLGLPVGHWGAAETAARFRNLAKAWRRWHERKYPAYYDSDQLYRLSSDPFEKKNLAFDPAYEPSLLRMQKMLSAGLAGLGRPFGEFKKEEL
ncbi:MAG: sulfatase-like hydrolase/transferase [Kiritimatiellales bacterium]